MKKIYERPDAEYVSLIAQEDISNSFDDDAADGEMDVESKSLF